MYLYNIVIRHLTETDTCYGRNLWRSQEFTLGGGVWGYIQRKFVGPCLGFYQNLRLQERNAVDII